MADFFIYKENLLYGTPCNAGKSADGRWVSQQLTHPDVYKRQTHTVCALDVKALLKYIQFDDPMAVFDAGVAAYLLNPLKSSYTYDDMAKEYLSGRILPAREELLGKKTVEKAWEESAEGLTAWGCYMAYTALACRKPMCEALHDLSLIHISGNGKSVLQRVFIQRWNVHTIYISFSREKNIQEVYGRKTILYNL